MATTDNRVRLTEHDTADALRLTLFDNDGNPTDITGYRFFLKIGYKKPLVKEATILDAPAGQFIFQFGFDDLKHGSYESQIMVKDASGQEKSTRGPYFDISRRVRGTP